MILWKIAHHPSKYYVQYIIKFVLIETNSEQMSICILKTGSSM
jgi:uncharacterized protein YcnI